MKVMIRFILPSTDTPWQKAEELGLKDKLAMKVGTVMTVMMVVMRVGTVMIVMVVMRVVTAMIVMMVVMKVDSNLSC